LTANPKQKSSLPCCLQIQKKKKKLNENTVKAQNSKLSNKRLVRIVTNLQWTKYVMHIPLVTVGLMLCVRKKKNSKYEIFAISYPYLLHMPWNGNHKKTWWTIYHIREQGISEVYRLHPEHPNNEKAEAKTKLHT